MPVLELTAGGEDHRVLVVRLLVGGNDTGGYELRAPVRRRKAVAEDDIVSGAIRCVAGIGDGALALQALPCNVVQRWHDGLHLGEYVAHVLEPPVDADSPRELLDDPPVLTRVAGEFQGLSTHLHLAIAVRDRTVLFGPRRGRQHHIRVECCLGEKNVLHHQMLELGQRRAGVIHIRIGHGGVLAHDVDALDDTVVHGIHDFHHRESTHRIEARAPGVLEAIANCLPIHRLVIGKHHRNEAGVRGALDIVLPAQRMQPGARPPHLSGDHRQRDQATCIVGAVHALGDPHAPEDNGALRACVLARHGADGVGVDAANILHGFGLEVLDVVLEILEAFGVRFHVLTIVEGLFDDDVEHGVQQRHIGSRIELQHVRGVALELLAARIHDDEGLRLGGLLEEGRRHRMIFRRVAAGNDDDIGVLAGGKGRRHGTGADALQQRYHRRGVTEARAVVHVVGAEARAHQLLHQIRLFVGSFRRSESGQSLGSVAVSNAFETRGGDVQRLFPARFPEVGKGISRIHLAIGTLGRVIPADEGLGEPVGVRHVVESEPSLHAQPLAIPRPVAALHRDDLIGVGLVGNLATDTAIGAHAVHFLQRDGAPDALLVHQARFHESTGGAGLHAFAAGDAGAGAHCVVEVEDDLRAVAAVGHADDVVYLYLAARAHAESAVNAGIEIDAHGRVARIGRR